MEKGSRWAAGTQVTSARFVRNNSWPARRRIVACLLITVPAGFGLKLYQGPGQDWVNNYAAGVLYEIFWCLVLFFLWPRRRHIVRIALGVLVGTGLLEWIQLWHPWILEQVRASFLGRTLIGTTFSWWDFPHYALGCALGWRLMRRIVRVRSISASDVPDF
jgi:hypothetical protein